jgi:hypothetical protein
MDFFPLPPALVPVQPPIWWVGTSGAYPGIKQPGREADDSSKSSAEVKNTWSYTSTPQYFFMVWCLIKQTIHLQGVALF